MSHVYIERLTSGAAIIRLGTKDERAVSLSNERMNSLEAALRELRSERPCGIIITGSSEDMFSVGADINAFVKLKTEEEAKAAARRGQDVFALIESLPFTTVAAISGPCVGGACELALACNYRIISDRPSSMIGLPETKLGIIPGFGGTQRLPRIVGLPKALDIILAGKTLKPQQALKAGLVSAVHPASQLLAQAENIACGIKPKAHKISLLDRLLTFTNFGRKKVEKRAKQDVLKQTKGHYPAPLAALEATLYGLATLDRAKGYDKEAELLSKMMVTSESRALVHIFFLTEAAKALGKPCRDKVKGLQATVVGAGVMGAGIASVLADKEIPVVLRDVNEDAVKKGMGHIKSFFDKKPYLSPIEKNAKLSKVKTSVGSDPNLAKSSLAIEAAFESMEVKKAIFAELAQQMGEDAILATNTSSLPISDIAREVPHPERVIGMHFFNPAEKMPLVEIVRGKQTSDKAMLLVAAMTTHLGKFPIVVEDVPGFLVNRILVPYLCEAAILLEEGNSLTSIDSAALAYGMPMGPFRLLDEVGLDVAAHVSEIMEKAYGERMKGPNFAARLVASGKKGKKSGSGFYDYQGGAEVPSASALQALSLGAKQAFLSQDEIQQRLICRLMNEAVLCLDEGVAGQPGPDAAKQIDLGTIMGTGFPAFRGGLIYAMESMGSAKLRGIMIELKSKYGERFAPAPGIEKRAASEGSFYA